LSMNSRKPMPAEIAPCSSVSRISLENQAMPVCHLHWLTG
jgi:hypothetical protein